MNRFRSVSIHADAAACAAAQRIAQQKFLAAHAPQLPLGGCDQPDQCHCRYKYYSDRRSDMRRDRDHGLPGQPYHGIDRRHRKDRRKAAAIQH